MDTSKKLHVIVFQTILNLFDCRLSVGLWINLLNLLDYVQIFWIVDKSVGLWINVYPSPVVSAPPRPVTDCSCGCPPPV